MMSEPTYSDVFREGWSYWDTFRPCRWCLPLLVVAWQAGRDQRLERDLEDGRIWPPSK